MQQWESQALLGGFTMNSLQWMCWFALASLASLEHNTDTRVIVRTFLIMTSWRFKIFPKWPNGPKYIICWDGWQQTRSFEGSQHMLTVFLGWIANTVTQFPSSFDRNGRSQKTTNGLKWRTWKPTHLGIIKSKKLKFWFEKIINFHTKTQPFSLKIHEDMFFVNVVATKNATNTSSPCNCNAPSVAACWLAHRLFSTGIYEFTCHALDLPPTQHITVTTKIDSTFFQTVSVQWHPGLGWIYSYHWNHEVTWPLVWPRLLW